MKDLLSPAVQGFQAVEGVGQKTADVVKKGLSGFTAASAAVVGFGTAAVNSGMKFDAAMSEVSAISGAAGDEFQSLRDKALEMGAKTKFSASEAAEAMTYMGMAGWKTEDMLGGIAGIMNLAAASGEDLATTSDIVTNALTAFGMSASESGHLADILATASSNANTDVRMMGESFKYAAPVMGTLGYSAEDTAVALGLMGNAGIQASTAGTSLKTAMLNMASPTKAMTGVMDKYGISLTDGKGKMYSLGEVMAQLRDKMGGLDETTKAAAASTLFGKEAAAGMLAIINAAPEDFDKLTAAIDNCNGSAERMSAIMMDNLAGDIQYFKSALESLQIAISDALTPTLREFAQFGQKAMAELLSGFQSGGVSGFMSALSGLVTEGVTMLAEKAPEFAGVSVQFIESLVFGILDAKSEIVDAGEKIISILIDGIYFTMENNEKSIIEFGRDIATMILNGFSEAGDVISYYIGAFIPLIAEAFLSYHETLFTVGLDILGAIGQGIIDNKEELQSMASKTIANMVTSLRENAPSIIDGGLALLEALVGAIEENLPLILETGGEIVGRLIEGISTASPGVQAIIATMVLPFITKIIDVIGGIGTAVKDAWGVIKKVIDLVSGGEGLEKIISIGKKLIGGIQTLFTLIMAHPVIAVIAAIIAALVLLWANCEEFRDFVKGMVEAIIGFFSGLYEGVSNALAGLAEFIGNVFSAAWELVKSAWESAVSFFQGIWDGIQAVFSTVAEVLGEFFSAAWDAVVAIWEIAGEWFSGICDAIYEVFETVTQAISDFFEAAGAFVKETWEGVRDFFIDLGEKLRELWEEVVTFFQEKFEEAAEAVQKAWEAVKDFFQGVWDKIVEIYGAADEWFGDLFSDAWNAITSVWDGAENFFRGIWDDITGVFSNVWDKFSKIGGDIVGGLKDGILGAWESFTSWLDRKVGGLIDGVKSLLGIHSPSTVFANIGENMALGLSEGWDDEYSAIKRQIEDGLTFAPASIGLNTSAQLYASNGYSGAGGLPTGGNTYVTINSPKAVDGVQAAREWKKTSQQIALGLV